MATVQKLRFIHLSDIHFSNKAVNIGFNPDRVLREAVVADIKKQREKLGPMSAILVSGDIAYAGKKDEYDDAAKWLDDITLAAGCGLTDVWLCPGNHDIDQAVLKEDSLITDAHDKIRSVKEYEKMNSTLNNRLVEPNARKLLYSPMQQYNEFAARYESTFFATEQNYAWEHDFVLNDGSILRLRALNTALLSGLNDNEKTLFLGSHACTFPKRAGVEYMLIAHHPPSWLADQKEAERAFDDHVRIQMFGHEHDQRIVPGKDWAKLFAGSINPHRLETNWKPGYNVIEVYIAEAQERKLVVDIHALEWQKSPPQFRVILDRMSKEVHSVLIELEKLPEDFERVSAEGADGSGEESEASAVNGSDDKSGPATGQVDFRTIVFRFFRLSLSKKNEIVGHLRLADDDDSKFTDVEKFKLALARARERHQLDEIASWIEKMEGAP